MKKLKKSTTVRNDRWIEVLRKFKSNVAMKGLLPEKFNIIIKHSIVFIYFGTAEILGYANTMFNFDAAHLVMIVLFRFQINAHALRYIEIRHRVN